MYKYYYMNNVRQEIIDLCIKGNVDLNTYISLKINSYEDKYIQPYLTDEAFLWKLKNYLKQVRQKTSIELSDHYEDYVAHDGIFELLRRYENANSV